MSSKRQAQKSRDAEIKMKDKEEERRGAWFLDFNLTSAAQGHFRTKTTLF